MYAVVRSGGKQFRVEPGDVVRVEKRAGNPGETCTLDEVLAVGGTGKPRFGAPLLEGVSVTAEILEQRKDEKVIVFKKKRRQHYRRKNGHRQQITVMRIRSVDGI